MVAARSLLWMVGQVTILAEIYVFKNEDKFAGSWSSHLLLFICEAYGYKSIKKVKMYIISIARRAVKELSETNIILGDCYYGHLTHFQYTSF